MVFGYILDRVRLKQLAQKKRLSMTVMAESLNYSRAAFSQKLSGKKGAMFDIVQVLTLSKLLEVDPEEIVVPECKTEAALSCLSKDDREAVLCFTKKLRENSKEGGNILCQNTFVSQ